MFSINSRIFNTIPSTVLLHLDSKREAVRLTYSAHTSLNSELRGSPWYPNYLQFRHPKKKDYIWKFWCMGKWNAFEVGDGLCFHWEKLRRMMFKKHLPLFWLFVVVMSDGGKEWVKYVELRSLQAAEGE